MVQKNIPTFNLWEISSNHTKGLASKYAWICEVVYAQCNTTGCRSVQTRREYEMIAQYKILKYVVGTSCPHLENEKWFVQMSLLRSKWRRILIFPRLLQKYLWSFICFICQVQEKQEEVSYETNHSFPGNPCEYSEWDRDPCSAVVKVDSQTRVMNE
jgi:hypothetical protein